MNAERVCAAPNPITFTVLSHSFTGSFLNLSFYQYTLAHSEDFSP